MDQRVRPSAGGRRTGVRAARGGPRAPDPLTSAFLVRPAPVPWRRVWGAALTTTLCHLPGQLTGHGQWGAWTFFGGFASFHVAGQPYPRRGSVLGAAVLGLAAAMLLGGAVQAWWATGLILGAVSAAATCLAGRWRIALAAGLMFILGACLSAAQPHAHPAARVLFVASSSSRPLRAGRRRDRLACRDERVAASRTRPQGPLARVTGRAGTARRRREAPQSSPAEEVCPPMARHPMRIEDLLDFRFPGDVQIAPDGRRAALVLSEFDRERNGYRSAIWLADLESATPRRITWGGRRDRQPRWAPDGRLAFLSDRGGEDQIWLLDLAAGGEARQLTSRKGGVSTFAWSPDGARLVLAGRDPRPEPQSPPGPDARYITRLRYKANGEGYRDDRRAHLYVADAETGEARQLTSGPWDDGDPAWSPDGTTIAFTSARGDEADPWFGSDLYTVPAAGGEARTLHAKPGGVSSPAFSPDGGQVAFLAAPGRASGENVGIWLVPARGGDARCLTAAFDHNAGCAVGSDLRRDSGGAGPTWIEGGRALLAVFADGPAARVYRIDPTSGAATGVAGHGDVAVSSFSCTADGRLIAGICGDATHPAEAWAWTAGDPRPLTAFNADTLANLDVASPEHVPYKSFDGQLIDAWVLRPAGAQPGRRHPLVIEVHGGPHAAYGHGLFHEFQVLAALGFGVLYTNPRGSIGYGEAFTQACVGDWGGGDYQDVMAAADMACTWDWVDPARLGITGGSYGGFMTNWVIGHTTRFAAAVTMRSVVNFFTKYGVSDNGWMHNARELGGADLWADEETVLHRSPLRYARHVRTPTMIIHSDEDYRCPLPEGEQLYVALRRLGVPTAFVRFTGENHELSRAGKPANRLERLRQMTAWFDRHLRPRA